MRLLWICLLMSLSPAAFAVEQQPATFLVSLTYCERDADAKDGRPRVLAEPRVITTAGRKAEIRIGQSVELPNSQELAFDGFQGLALEVTCGEQRDGKVPLDVVLRRSAEAERQDELVTVEEQSVHVAGRISLAVEQRINISKKADSVEQYVLLKIEHVEADKQLPLGAPGRSSRKL